MRERAAGRDKGPSPRAFLRQLAAIQAWGRQPPQDLGRIRIPGAELVLHPDAGHGGIFQHDAAFVRKALAFLAA